MRRTTLLRGSLAVTAAVALTSAALPVSPASAAPRPTPSALAAASADRLVAGPSAASMLKVGAGDELRRTAVIAGTRGLQYVTYARTYKGLPVSGGDAVVTTDASGAVRDTSVAQSSVINVGTAATVAAATAVTTSKAQLASVTSTSPATLLVLAGDTAPALAYETVVTGFKADGANSVLHVFVDATTGRVLQTRDDVRDGTGTGHWYGPVSIATSGSGSSFSMTDTTHPGLKCGGQSGTAFTGTDDSWGNGSASDLETACVDVLFAAQREDDMLRDWLGRNGITGSGGDVPARVGWNVVNAQWNGSYTNFGHSQDGLRQLTSIDVVGHERGHAIFQNTPGGAGANSENAGINESTGDIFGALTEAYANVSQDPPDYTVGELIDLTGDGPIRYMYNPSLVGDPNCYSTSLPAEEHAAAGPQNHWFFLTAEGSSPTTGQPNSPTCNNTSVSGLGIRKAGEIFYNALLAKTSTWRYANVRVATLNAAKNLFPGSCTEFDTVKAAWTAVSVPAQSGEPTCTGGTPAGDFSIAAAPASGSVAAGSAISTTVSTATTSGSAQTVALTASGLPTGATATFTPASVTSGASSTLRIATSAATPSGTFPITVTGTGTATHAATFTLTVTGGTGGGSCTGTNGTDVPIPDAGAAVTSTITISGCGRAPSTTSTVAVSITHTYRGDLVLDLVAPDGTAYRLKNSSTSDSADNVNSTFTANLSGEAADGAWKLRAQDVARQDTGFINTWTLTL